MLTLYIDSAPSYFRAVVPGNKDTRALQELRVLVGVYDDDNDDETCFLQIKQPLENLRSLIISEHIPKVVLKVHRCRIGEDFPDEAFEKKMRECLFVQGEQSQVEIQWEKFYWRMCGRWYYVCILFSSYFPFYYLY